MRISALIFSLFFAAQIANAQGVSEVADRGKEKYSAAILFRDPDLVLFSGVDPQVPQDYTDRGRNYFQKCMKYQRQYLKSGSSSEYTVIGSGCGKVSGVWADAFYIADQYDELNLTYENYQSIVDILLAVDWQGNVGIKGSLQLGVPLAVQYGGTGTSNPSLIAGPGIAISGTWPNQMISVIGGGGGGGGGSVFSNITIGSNPSLWIGQDTSGGPIMFRINQGTKDAWVFSVPDISAANPVVTVFGGANLGANPVLNVQGALQLSTPLAVAYGGTGTSSPSLVAGAGISITGAWPNQTITNTDDSYFSSGILTVAHGGTGLSSPSLIAGPGISISGPWPNQTITNIDDAYFSSGILTVAHGGTGTANPGLIAGTNILVTGNWPNQNISTVASPSFTSLVVGSSPQFTIRNNGSGSTLVGSNTGQDAWFLSLPDLSTAGPTVQMFGGTQLGASPVLQINGSLQLTTPLAVAYGGTGTSSPGLIAGAGISISGNWPNQTIANLDDAYFSAGVLTVAHGGTGTSTPGLVAGAGISVSGTWPNQTITNSDDAYFSSGVLTVAHGGTGTSTPALVAGSNVSISGTWPNQTIATSANPNFSTVTIGSSPGIWIGQDGGAGDIKFRTNQSTNDAWLFDVPSLSAANPTVNVFGGTNLGANPVLKVNGALQLATPLAVAYGGTGTSTPGLVAGAGISISGSWPNQTITNADDSYFSSGILAVAHGGTGTSSPSLVAGAGISISGTWPNQTIVNSDDSYFSSGILSVAHGGTGTSSPSLVAGSNISVSGTWPNQTVATVSSPSFAGITIGANPSFWIGQDGGTGDIRLRTNQATKDTWLFDVPDLSTSGPTVQMFGGTNLGSNPVFKINGSLQLTTPLAVAYGGTGTSSPSLVAGAGISISGTWPNQTVTNTDDAYFSGGILTVAHGGTGTSTPGLVAGSGISISGTWPNQTITNSDDSYFSSGILTVAHGGTGTSSPALMAGSNISVSGSWPNQTIATVSSPSFSSVMIGSNPSFWIGQDGGTGDIRLRTNQATKDTWLLDVPDLSTAGPTVQMFGGANLGANPVLKVNGSLQLTTPLAVAYGGTGTSSPGLVAGAGISVSGTWPNQTITNSDDAYFSSGILTVAHGGTGTSTPGLVAGAGISISGTWPNQTVTNADDAYFSSGILTVAHGGTGTSNPSLVAGTGISITGTWPNQTVSLASGGGTSAAASVSTSTASTSFATAIGTTTLVSTSQNSSGGPWIIGITTEVSAVGSGCPTNKSSVVSVTISFTDPVTNASASVTGNAQISFTGNGTLGTAARAVVPIPTTANSAISYSTTVTTNTGCTTQPQYQVFLQAIH